MGTNLGTAMREAGFSLDGEEPVQVELNPVFSLLREVAGKDHRKGAAYQSSMAYGLRKNENAIPGKPGWVYYTYPQQLEILKRSPTSALQFEAWLHCLGATGREPVLPYFPDVVGEDFRFWPLYEKVAGLETMPVFDGWRFENCNFFRGVLSGTHFFECEFVGCDAYDAVLDGAVLENCVVRDSNFRRTHMSGGKIRVGKYARERVVELPKGKLINTRFLGGSHCRAAEFGDCDRVLFRDAVRLNDAVWSGQMDRVSVHKTCRLKDADRAKIREAKDSWKAQSVPPTT